MIPLIAENKDTIVRLCREYGIRKLDVFGSAVTGAFNADTSDIDFIVDLGGYERGVFRRYFGFADALEQALGREVDLVTEVQIRDPYFRHRVEEQRINVFASGDSKAAA